MTPTVLMEYRPQMQIKRSYVEIAYRGMGYAETVGGSGSPVRVDSEDSSAPKCKCIGLNSDGFDVKQEIFVPSKLSSSERRYLRKRFRAELGSVMYLLKRPEFFSIMPVSRAPSDA
uniref:Uncharacterized protein n=1 Tax=Aegilops tauschii subsp. strangulata TaxID=200361 RepID=A0A453QLF2_AEGTS